MKQCMNFSSCRGEVSNPIYDLCGKCFLKLSDFEKDISPEETFKENLNDDKTHNVYIMFYGENNDKVGYTAHLDSRVFELKRKYPNNELVYFREFTKQSEARRFEVYLKGLSERELSKFISRFQDKIKKIKIIV